MMQSDWVLNYLTGRKQYVQINEKQSQVVDVQFGMPQESILLYYLICM